MYFKHFFKTVIAVTVLLVVSLSAFAQTGAVRGTVTLKQADGKTVPVADAVVDAFRLDVPGRRENMKTNKRGEFHIIGLFVVGKWILSVSAPGARPYIKGGIKPGQDVDIPIVLEAGDGRRYTFEQAKELAEGDNSSPTGGGGGGIQGGNNSDGLTSVGSVGLNYRKDYGKKVSSYGNYSFSNRDNDVISDQLQQNNFQNSLISTNQNSIKNLINNIRLII